MFRNLSSKLRHGYDLEICGASRCRGHKRRPLLTQPGHCGQRIQRLCQRPLLILLGRQLMIAKQTEIPHGDAKRRAQIVDQLGHRVQRFVLWHVA
jgi:hypothetical protein